MVVSFLGCKTLIHFFFYQALQKLFRLRGVSRERLMVEMEVSLDHISDNFQLRVTWERNFARKHDVEDDTK